MRLGSPGWLRRGLVFLQITPSERDALELLANGTTTDEIARCLGVTVSEVEARLAALFAKMGTATRAEMRLLRRSGEGWC